MKLSIYMSIILPALPLVPLLCGCSSLTKGDTRLHHVAGLDVAKNRDDPAQNDWLDERRVEITLRKQLKMMSESEQSRLAHINCMLTQQEQADILLELLDQDNIQLIDSKIMADFPKRLFPVADLQKYLPPRNTIDNEAIPLVVVITPHMFPAEEGKPSQLDLIRAIDRVLRVAGVERRVFQMIGGMHFYKLDSECFKEAAH